MPLLLGILFMSAFMQAQLRVEPPNWWVGMRNTGLQILLYGKGIADYRPELDYAGISITAWHPGASENYLFVDLEIGPEALPGSAQLSLKHPSKEPITLTYPIHKRNKPAESYKGFDSSDAIYLITPDRFSNGDPRNDIVKGMREEKLDRKGIRQHLGYIDEMGFTAIWSSPLLTNDMPEASYHGYAITDFYEEKDLLILYNLRSPPEYVEAYQKLTGRLDY